MSDLDGVLDKYNHDSLSVAVSHDGFRIYHGRDENEPGYPGELVWSWDPAHDREPFEALETLFERQGFEVEQM